MSWLEIIGTLVGLVYLWLEYKASIWLWLASVIMPAIYLVIYYQAGLYADFGINVYYLIIAIYGIWLWLGGSAKNNKRELPITATPSGLWWKMGIVSMAIFFLIAYILISCTDSNVPWMDSFTTSLSIVAMWMLARKYVEQWLVWIVVDAVSAGLYIYKELYFTAGLYALYAIIAYFGYREWRRLML